MAAKKPGKSGKKSSQPQSTTKATDAANKALLAASTPESPDDAKKEIIFRCIVSVFDAQGLNHINDQQDKIVWSTIDDEVIVALGDDITDCINSKGFVCSPLAPSFQFLKNKGRVSVVSNLILSLVELVTS